MGTKLDPGSYDCYEKAEPDEPMFVLLARDPRAPAMVRRWIAQRELDPDTPVEQIREAYFTATAMEQWRIKHAGK